MKKIFCKTKFIIIICLYFVSSFGSPVKTFNIYPPEYDICFKKVFVESPESKEILKDLLNTIYGYNGDLKIRDIEYLPNTLPNRESRPIYFDIKCRCYLSETPITSPMTSYPNNSIILDVEMQRAFQQTFVDRINMYKSRLEESEFDSNKKLKIKNYFDLPTVRMLSFLKEPFNKNYPFMFHMLPILAKSELQNGSITGECEILDLPATNKELATFIQLSKLEECTNPKLKEWLHFLNLGGDNPSSKTCIDVYSNEFSNNEIIKALIILNKFSSNYDTKSLMDSLEDNELAANTQILAEKRSGIMLDIEDYMKEKEVDSITAIQQLKQKDKFKKHPDFMEALCIIEKEELDKKRKLENEATLEHPSKKSKSEKSDK